MSHSHTLEHLDNDLWRMEYPLKTMGADLRRVVTIIRLSSGKLIIHSTAPFTPVDVDVIQELGRAEWLVDVLLRHDTFAAEGHAAFPEASYLAPEGFSTDLSFPTGSLLSPPMEWEGEVEVVAVEGAPDFGEIVMLHRSSRTLIVGDLVINFGEKQNWWTKLLLKLASVNGHHHPGVTKPFKSAIKDMDAYTASIAKIFEWDFDRVIVGHGDVIQSGGKQKLLDGLRRAGIPV